MTAPRFTPRPLRDVGDEYDHPSLEMLRGTFDIDWRQADRSVGETESGYVAALMHARFGGLYLTREQVMQALGASGLRDWEEYASEEANER